jgi:serine/threonine protein kinase
MGSLKKFTNEYGCSMENAMRYLSQIAEAVSFLHNRRFIHRNLRADSAFVYTNGEVSLIYTFEKLTIQFQQNSKLKYA